MVAARPEVERFGLSLPKVKRPHSGLPKPAQPCRPERPRISPAQRPALAYQLALGLRHRDDQRAVGDRRVRARGLRRPPGGLVEQPQLARPEARRRQPDLRLRQAGAAPADGERLGGLARVQGADVHLGAAAAVERPVAVVVPRGQLDQQRRLLGRGVDVQADGAVGPGPVAARVPLPHEHERPADDQQPGGYGCGVRQPLSCTRRGWGHGDVLLGGQLVAVNLSVRCHRRCPTRPSGTLTPAHLRTLGQWRSERPPRAVATSSRTA